LSFAFFNPIPAALSGFSKCSKNSTFLLYFISWRYDFQSRIVIGFLFFAKYFWAAKARTAGPPGKTNTWRHNSDQPLLLKSKPRQRGAQGDARRERIDFRELFR